MAAGATGGAAGGNTPPADPAAGIRRQFEAALERGVPEPGEARRLLELAGSGGEAGERHRRLELLAELALHQGALALAGDALRRLLAVPVPDPLDAARHRHWLGIVLAEQGSPEEGLALQRQALEVFRAASGRKALEGQAEVLNELGMLAYQDGDYRRAGERFDEAMALACGELGEDHPRCAETMENLAWARVRTGDPAAAEALFRAGVRIQEQAPEPREREIAHSLSNLGHFLLDQGRAPEAAPVLARVVAIRRQALPPGHPDLARSLQDLATAHEALGHALAAERLFREAVRVQREGRLPSGVMASTLNNLGVLYFRLGRQEEARAALAEALELARASLGPDHPELAGYLNNVGRVWLAEGRHAEAERAYREALRLTEAAQGADHPQVAVWLNNLGRVLRAQGRLVEAREACQRALRIQTATYGVGYPGRMVSLMNLGQIELDRGRVAEALAFLDEAEGLWSPSTPGAGPDGLRLRRLRARALLSRERLPQALAEIDRGLAGARRILAATSTEVGSVSREVRRFLEGVVALAADRRDPELRARAFEATQLALAGSDAGALARMSLTMSAGQPELGALLRRRQELAERRRVTAARWVKGLLAGKVEGDPGASLEALDERIGAADAAIARLAPGFTGLLGLATLEPHQARRLLAPDTALLIFLVAPADTYLWVLTRETMELHALGLEARRLAGAVRWLRRGLTDPGFPLGFDGERGERLCRRLLGPALDDLEGIRDLVEVPDGPLHALPLAALPCPGAEAAAGGRQWLVERWSVAVAPSLAALGALRERPPRSRGDRPLLGLGAPEPPPGAGRLARLPEAAEELRRVAAVLGDGDLLVGSGASERALRARALDRYRTLVFATHGLLGGEVEGLEEPALLVGPGSPDMSPRDGVVGTSPGDGYLTAAEISGLELDADWVVLSACNTGAATQDVSGLSSLSRAFLFAGARALVVTHWAVDSGATAQLVARMFRAWNPEAGLGRARALQQAQLRLIRGEAGEGYAHPYFWAGFSLVGDGQ